MRKGYHGMCIWFGRRWRVCHVSLTIVLFAQLLCGTLYVTVRAQYVAPAIEQARRTQELSDRTMTLAAQSGDINERLKVLEAFRIDARLSVLEDMATEMRSIRLLLYGLIITTLGTLILKIVELKKKS